MQSIGQSIGVVVGSRQRGADWGAGGVGGPGCTGALAHQRTSALQHRRTAAPAHRSQVAYHVQREKGTESHDEGREGRDLDNGAGSDGRAPACPVRHADLLDLQGHPGHPPFRSAYRMFIGGDQPRCAPGDVQTAGRMVRAIEEAQEHGGWSAAERTRLARMHRVWTARAQGRDARFALVGNRPGRLSGDDERRLRLLGRVLQSETGVAGRCRC